MTTELKKSKSSEVITHTFKIMKVGTPGISQRLYPESVIKIWQKLITTLDYGIPVENSLNDEYETDTARFVSESHVIGGVVKLVIDEEGYLHGTVNFKVTTDFYQTIKENKELLNEYLITPKGDGNILKQTVLDDFRIISFMLVNKKESPFHLQ